MWCHPGELDTLCQAPSGSWSLGLSRALCLDSLDEQHIGLQASGIIGKHLLADKVNDVLWLQKQNRVNAYHDVPCPPAVRVLISGQLGSSKVSRATLPRRPVSTKSLTHQGFLASIYQSSFSPLPSPQSILCSVNVDSTHRTLLGRVWLLTGGDFWTIED